MLELALVSAVVPPARVGSLMVPAITLPLEVPSNCNTTVWTVGDVPALLVTGSGQEQVLAVVGFRIVAVVVNAVERDVSEGDGRRSAADIAGAGGNGEAWRAR